MMLRARVDAPIRRHRNRLGLARPAREESEGPTRRDRTPTDELAAGGPIFVVAITTTLIDPLPDDHVPLPWQRPRHPRTGLNERNAAVCHWLASVEPDRALRVIGNVSNAELAQIAEILRRLADES